MGITEDLVDRNATHAAHRFAPGLRMMPSLRTIVIGCVDPRVDPTDVLGTTPGEVAAIRNVGGRVTPAVVSELVMLRAVTQAAGGDLGPGWELIVLHHTDCGITRLTDRPEMLAGFLGVDVSDLDGQAVTDPRAAVAVDVATLRAETRLEGVRVSGLVYDVDTGVVTTAVAPTPLRPAQAPPEVDRLPDLGSLRADLLAVIDSERLADVVRREATEPYVEVYRRLLHRANERGEIGASRAASIPVLAEVVPAMSTHRTPVERAFFVSLVDDVVLAALGVADA